MRKETKQLYYFHKKTQLQNQLFFCTISNKMNYIWDSMFQLVAMCSLEVLMEDMLRGVLQLCLDCYLLSSENRWVAPDHLLPLLLLVAVHLQPLQ